MEKVATWVGGSLANAFFASLERSSCVTLSTTDTDEEEEDTPLEIRVGTGQQSITSGATNSTNSSYRVGLVGHDRFVRSNPLTDRFTVHGFHHVEFWCGDATNTWRRFAWGLGMHLVAKSDQTTGNNTYCSYAIRSNEVVFTFTAPYSSTVEQGSTTVPHPGFRTEDARRFFTKHGLGVRAVGLLVDNAEEAFRRSVLGGALAVLQPVVLTDADTGGKTVVSEVKLFGDVVLRFVSMVGFQGPFLPNYKPVESLPLASGLQRLSYVAGIVYNLLDTVNYLVRVTGFHEVAELTADDVGSGLNTMALASNNEEAALVLSEPTYGRKRKSPVQTYLEHNEGPGVQRLAMYSNDIFATVQDIQDRIDAGGFELMAAPKREYYESVRGRVSKHLTQVQFDKCAELGILLDQDDDRGLLLQIFTKPVGDRPTLILEFIQRLPALSEDKTTASNRTSHNCDIVGKDNHSALYKCLEEYEKSFEAAARNPNL